MSFRSRFVEIESHFIKLPLLKGKKEWLPLIIPPKFKKVFSLDYGNVVLKRNNGDWFTYLSFYIPCKEEYKPNGWFGIDLGINNILVLSDPKGKVNKFYNGKRLKKIREEFYQKRKLLQSQKGRDNNKWKALKALSEKETNYTDYVNHKISKEVVELAKRYQYGLVMEDLSRIKKTQHKRFNRMLSSWKFRDLIGKIEYKSEVDGVPLEFVNPKNTSKTCSRCGEINDIGTKKQFKCHACGFELNRDLNSARYIATIPLSLKGEAFLVA